MSNSRNGVSGWRVFPFVADVPTTDDGPRRHGNWKHGRYSKDGKQGARYIRYVCAALAGRATWHPPAGSPGWRLFPYVA